MVHYIEKLIREGEHQQQDFKFCITDSRKIAKSLSAFANTDGGRLLIGVKDNGKIAGTIVDEEFHMIQAAAEMYSKPKIEFESKVWTIHGKNVLEITIEPSDDMPHSAQNENGKWLAYVRKDDENKLANRILLEVWKRKSKPTGTYLEYTETESLLLDHLKINESISLNKFCRLAKISRYKAERILVKLICWEVLEPNFEEKGTSYKLKQVESSSL
ncbi:AlbA family DNA-binding domain-containing protein [Marinifilum flexuosum]|uniref:Putative DNA-binding protein n=1 Tax=Marinifilum flexuosum TaxID=1117708 RepID=A0A419X9W8_9BACT|nr:RNA-binding domain-containing protein [Marinifilum flexuosum]RKE04553.1 putative DNA-binding protein [Marinifilum flexuosum]